MWARLIEWIRGLLVEALALTSALLASISSVVITPVAKEGMAMRLMVVRSAFGALFVSVAILLLPAETGLGKVTGLGLAVILVVSAPVFAVGAVAYYRSIESMGLARTYPLVNIFPLFSTMLAIVLLGERPHWPVLAGTLVIVAGVWLVGSRRENNEGRFGLISGFAAYKWIAVMVGAAILFAISTTANKVALNTGLSPLLVNLGRTACAGSLTMAVGRTWGRGLGLRALPRASWMRIAFAALIADLVGHYMYFTAMQMGELSTVVPLAATTPLFIIPLAYVILKESINWSTSLGTLLTVVGVVLVLLS
jgi:transporter family protein